MPRSYNDAVCYNIRLHLISRRLISRTAVKGLDFIIMQHHSACLHIIVVITLFQGFIQTPFNGEIPLKITNSPYYAWRKYRNQWPWTMQLDNGYYRPVFWQWIITRLVQWSCVLAYRLWYGLELHILVVPPPPTILYFPRTTRGWIKAFNALVYMCRVKLSLLLFFFFIYRILACSCVDCLCCHIMWWIKMSINACVLFCSK